MHLDGALIFTFRSISYSLNSLVSSWQQNGPWMEKNGKRERSFSANASDTLWRNNLPLFDLSIAVTGVGPLGVNTRHRSAIETYRGNG